MGQDLNLNLKTIQPLKKPQERISGIWVLAESLDLTPEAGFLRQEIDELDLLKIKHFAKPHMRRIKDRIQTGRKYICKEQKRSRTLT